VLDGVGIEAVIDHDVDRALTRLDDVALLVVNAGDPWVEGADGELDPGDSASTDAASRALEAALARGVGVLAMHSALASLRDHAAWAAAIGGMWVPRGSWHPPLGTTRIEAGALPDGTALPTFTVEDERYCRLQRIGQSHDIAWHTTDGERMPAAWVREVGPARIAVDSLGHDERSYESDGHRAFLAALARWLVADR
jgi:type 1 glutamine amidotransferase